MEDQPSRVVTNLRKSGKLAEAWDFGCHAVQENPNDAYLKGAFFWVCYDYLKEVQVPIKERAKQNNGNFQLNQTELERIEFLLDWVIWLDIPAGGFEYRNLLLLFQKNLDRIPKLVLLLVEHQRTLFEGDDKQPFPTEKGESPSLMLSFARKVAKSWQEFEPVRQIPIEQLVLLFDRVRNEAKDKQHLIWLNYDQAKCLIVAGHLLEARKCALSVLSKKQTESWAWRTLAATYRGEDADAAITLFAEGWCHAHDEKFALPILCELATLLAGQGSYPEASMCVLRAVNVYQSEDWRLKPELEKLTQADWYDANADLGELDAFLTSSAEGALNYLHGELEQRVGVVLNVHQSGKGFHVYFDHTRNDSVRLGLYVGSKPPTPGDYVNVSLASDSGEVVAAEPCEAVKLTDVDEIEGLMRVTDKGFGFVDETFVPPYLIFDGVDGQLVRATRVLDMDKKKNRLGWKAISLEVI